MMNEFVIGVLGGMGTYATIHLFQQYAELFPAEKEWDRPRIIIDNRCTMPSRVRAFLYNENTDILISQMTDSLKNLMDSGCARIVLDCNTSHLFLPEIYKKLPDLKDRLIHLIFNCVDSVYSDGVKEVFVLGTEGTIDSQIYQNALSERNITPLSPSKEEYHILRNCIEAVKQNIYTAETKEQFLELINRHDNCILGCTELPILYERYKDDVRCDRVYDPLYLALRQVHNDYLRSISK